MPTEIKAAFNSIFKPFNETKARYRIAMGSAGSGKSYNIAQDYILKLSDKRYQGANLLVVRGTEASHKNSTYSELLGAISRLGLSGYWTTTSNPMEMHSLITGNSIIFRGFNDARARERVKSINFPNGKLTWVWCEEATELMENDIDILDDRMRGQLAPTLYYQMTLSFNPVSASHWIKRKYWDYESPDIFKHHSTYLDNRFIDAAYHKRMELRKQQDYEGYRVYGLGEWGETAGLILSNYTIEELNPDYACYDSAVIAQDFGYNHANAILLVAFRDDEMYVLDEIYVYEKDTSEIIDVADATNLSKKLTMYCDSAEPDRIKMWQKAGYRAIGVKKEAGSVAAQIDYLKQHRIHIDVNCINTIREIQQWKWKKDNRTNLYLDEPVAFMDDAMAALRYSIEEYRRQKKKLQTINKSSLGI